MPDDVSRSKSLVAALKQRFARVLQVIDEALNSPEFRERIWAVEQILKRLKPNEKAREKSATRPAKKKKPAVREDFSALSEPELLAKIQALLDKDTDHGAQDDHAE